MPRIENVQLGGWNLILRRGHAQKGVVGASLAGGGRGSGMVRRGSARGPGHSLPPRVKQGRLLDPVTGSPVLVRDQKKDAPGQAFTGRTPMQTAGRLVGYRAGPGTVKRFPGCGYRTTSRQSRFGHPNRAHHQPTRHGRRGHEEDAPARGDLGEKPTQPVASGAAHLGFQNVLKKPTTGGLWSPCRAPPCTEG
jgi:hypothetical protein